MVNGDDIMSSVFIYNAQVADVLLICAAENLHEFVVLRTDALFESSCSQHQFVSLRSHMQNVVYVQMGFAV